MIIYQPYTYLIGWSNHNKWYYGVRYAQNCNPQDLWKTYFTSSKHVKKFREEYGEPDVIQVRKVFYDREKALLWEEKVLIKMNVLDNNMWLNKTTNKAISIEAARIGAQKPKSTSMREKIRISRKGKKHSIETKQKISNSNKGRKGTWKNKKLPEYMIKKLSDHGKALIGNKNPFFGKKHTEETKEKIRQSKLKNSKTINKNDII